MYIIYYVYYAFISTIWNNKFINELHIKNPVIF